MNVGIVVAAGKSERMGPSVDKAFLSLGSKPVLAYALTAFEKCQDIDRIVLVVRKDRLEAATALAKMFGCSKVKKVVAGGLTRQISVQNGLEYAGDETKIVVVHDGARPLVTPELISETIASAKKFGSGVAASKVTDTIKWVETGNKVAHTVDRAKLWAVQTPQAFKLAVLLKAFAAVNKKGAAVTDESSALELLGEEVRLVPTSLPNIKITSPDDLQMAAALLKV